MFPIFRKFQQILRVNINRRASHNIKILKLHLPVEALSPMSSVKDYKVTMKGTLNKNQPQNNYLWIKYDKSKEHHG